MRRLAPLLFALVTCRSFAAPCEVQLAEHLLNPVTTFAPKPGVYEAMDEDEFLRYAIRTHGLTTGGRRWIAGRREDPELSLQLALEQHMPTQLWSETEFVIHYDVARITFDQLSGEVGHGAMGGEAVRPKQWFIRVTPPSPLRYSAGRELRTYHEVALPQFIERVAVINVESEFRFGRSVLAPPQQTYPAEYVSEFVKGVTADEMAFVLSTLIKREDEK